MKQKVLKIEVLVTGLSFVFFKDSVDDSLPKASPDTKYNKIQVICYFKLLSCVFYFNNLVKNKVTNIIL